MDFTLTGIPREANTVTNDFSCNHSCTPVTSRFIQHVQFVMTPKLLAAVLLSRGSALLFNDVVHFATVRPFPLSRLVLPGGNGRSTW